MIFPTSAKTITAMNVPKIARPVMKLSAVVLSTSPVSLKPLTTASPVKVTADSPTTAIALACIPLMSAILFFTSSSHFFLCLA